MTPPSYMQEPWFALLKSRCVGAVQAHIAKALGISATSLSMILNGTGPYGEGKASTARIAERVITAEQCRSIAHRLPPTGSPRDMQHWQACRKCPHLEASAPPVERDPIPRKTKTEETTHV